MATVFETRLIGNIGKDATLRNMENGVIAINFPVAHNKNWRDKKTGQQKTKTTWVNCTIWKKEGANLRIMDFLKKGTLVEIQGTPFAKGYLQDDNTVKTEIRLNVSKTNILRPGQNTSKHNSDESFSDDVSDTDGFDNISKAVDDIEDDLF
ncbi:MAG TPA: single-stranded DNA-binding protein [Crocinitomix sp.]|nr:single-stranded DNA-binding protein [Crocinitomix sp.]